MIDNTIDSLKEALAQSPNNIPLRKLLAETLVGLKRYDEAEKEYAHLLKVTNNPKYKLDIGYIFYAKGQYSTCIVIMEEVMANEPENTQAYILCAKALIKENAINEAIDMYQKALSIDNELYDEELDNTLRIPQGGSHLDDPFDEDYDDPFDNRFLEKPNIHFEHVGGMDAIKKEIELKIIKPLLHPELYAAYGKKVGGGILMYGPPGCGKTYLAKATAGEINAKFISVGLNDILDMWIGNSEKNLHDIFELARANTPCVLFIDEIDALGASRSDMKQSGGRHLINQFLQELDGIDNNNDGVLILGATNTPWNLDPAFRRPGRFDRILFVPPPDQKSREAILRLKLASKPTENIEYEGISKKTENFSGADIDALIDIAIEQKLEAAFVDGIPKPINTKDLLEAVKKHKASTQEWFMTAKNFAMFANDAGLYDDILNYLKIKK